MEYVQAHRCQERSIRTGKGEHVFRHSLPCLSIATSDVHSTTLRDRRPIENRTSTVHQAYVSKRAQWLMKINRHATPFYDEIGAVEWTPRGTRGFLWSWVGLIGIDSCAPHHEMHHATLGESDTSPINESSPPTKRNGASADRGFAAAAGDGP